MNPTAVALLERRMKKAIAIVLGVKEREVDGFLPRDVSDKLRKVVLDQFNEYHEMVLDVVRSLDNGTVVLNEHYLELIEQLHSRVVGNDP
jgi:hypothetical protein